MYKDYFITDDGRVIDLIPENLFDISNTNATMENGLLVVRIPKRIKENPKNKTVNLPIN